MDIVDITKCKFTLMTADGGQFNAEDAMSITPVYLTEDWQELGITIEGKPIPIASKSESPRFVIVPIDVLAEGLIGNTVVLTLCLLPTGKSKPRPLTITEQRDLVLIDEYYKRTISLPHRDIRHVKQLIHFVQKTLELLGMCKPYTKCTDDDIRKSDLYRIIRNGGNQDILTCMLSDPDTTDEQLMPDMALTGMSTELNMSRRSVPGSQSTSPLTVSAVPMEPIQPSLPRDGELPVPPSELDNLLAELRAPAKETAEIIQNEADNADDNGLRNAIIPEDVLMEDMRTYERREGLLSPEPSADSIIVIRRNFDIPNYGKMLLYDPDLSDVPPERRVEKFVLFNMDQMPDIDDDSLIRIYMAGESRYNPKVVQPADTPAVVTETAAIDWNADAQQVPADNRSQVHLENVRKRQNAKHPDDIPAAILHNNISNCPIYEHRWTQSQRYPKGCIVKRPRLNQAEHPLAVSRDVKMGKHSLTARKIFDVTGGSIPTDLACNAIAYTSAIVRSNFDYICSTPARVEFGCLLTNGWSTPHKRIQSRVTDSVPRFHRTTRAPDANDLTCIIWTASKCVATYTPPQLEAMKINAHSVSRDFVEPIISPSYLYDNSGLYLHLMSISTYLYDITTNGGRIIAQDPAPAEVLETVCISLTGPHARNAANKMRQAAQNGRCILNANSFTAREQSVMRLLSNGIESIPHDRNLLKATQQLFKFDKVHFTLYHDRLNADGTAADVLYPNEPVTAEDVYHFAFNLAEVLNDYSSLYRGVISFCAIMHGQCVGQGCGNGQKGKIVYMTNMYEIGEMHFPAPRFPNPFHRMLGWCADPDTQEHIAGEIIVLRDMELNYFRMVCASIGVMLSISVGVLLHNYNITGRDMNHNIRLIANSASRNFCEFLSKFGKTGRSMLYNATTGVLNAFGNIILNPMYMPSREWNQRFVSVSTWEAGPQMLWQGRFGNKSLYMYKPLCCAFQMIEYPSPWGLSWPGVTYNFNFETLLGGRAEDSGFFPGVGTDSYAAARSGNTPAKFVSYGIFCINAYKQQHHSRDHFIITAEVYKLPVCNSDIYREAERLTPEWDDDLYMIEIGSMPSYDWELHQVLVPCILYTDAPQFVNNCARHAVTDRIMSLGGLGTSQATVLANSGMNVTAYFSDYFADTLPATAVRGREVSTGMLATSLGNTGEHIPPAVALPTNAPTSAIPGGSDPASQILPATNLRDPVVLPEPVNVGNDAPPSLPMTQGGNPKN